MDDKKITKLLCIGSNCIAADITTSLGVREPGPVDNFSCVNIWKSHLLFNNGIYKILFKDGYKERESTDFEKFKYHYIDKVFSFNQGIYIVHNNFEDEQFKNSLKRRIRAFHRYYFKSKFNKHLWYVYTLNPEDKNLAYIHFVKIKKSLPKCCSSRLICIGMRGKNPLFEKFFNYYIEFDNEENFKWHNKEQAKQIFADELKRKYNLEIITEQ